MLKFKVLLPYMIVEFCWLSTTMLVVSKLKSLNILQTIWHMTWNLGLGKKMTVPQHKFALLPLESRSSIGGSQKRGYDSSLSENLLKILAH